MPTQEELEKMIRDCMKKKGWTYEHCQRYIAGGIWGGMSPTPSDVHIPGQTKVKKEKKGEQPFEEEKEIYSIQAVPILKAGKWIDAHGTKTEFTIDDLDEIVRNTNALLKANLLEPVLKLGHEENQNFGMPAIGYVANVYRLGDTVFADFKDVPKKIYDLIKKRAYSKVSSEVYMGFEHPTTKENIGKTLRAVALLGADLPAIKGLGDIENLYHSEPKEQKYQSLFFSEMNIQEDNKMKIITLEEVQKILPCCVDAIKKFMEEDKIKELTTDKLAEYITKIRIMKLQEKEEKIECPAGYKWDENKGECVPESGILQDSNAHICPKGYKWDEEAKKCLPVEIAEEKDKKEKKNEVKEISIKPEDWTDEDKKELKAKFDEAVKAGYKDNPEDKRPPKGWWDKCVDAVKDVSDDPAALCGWIYHHHMSPERKAEIEATRQSESEKKTEEAKKEEQTKMSELEEKVKKLEIEKLNAMIKELKEKNRNILLPKFDEYISKFSEMFSSQENKVIKFGEKEFSPLELFFKFLNDIVQAKTVILSELAKTNEKAKEEISVRYADIKPGVEVKNIDLALLAEEISEKEHIPYRDALVKANKIMKQTNQ